MSARRIGERTLRSGASGRLPYRTRAPLTQEQITSSGLGSTVGSDGRLGVRSSHVRGNPGRVCAARGGVLSVTQARANHNARRGRTVGDIVQQLRLWRSRPPARALHHTLHRLAKRADRQFGRTHQGVSPVRQLLTLLDQPARSVPRVLRSPPHFRRNVRAGEEVLANVRGQVGATARAQVRAVLQQVGGKLVLPEALAASAALCDDVIEAEPRSLRRNDGHLRLEPGQSPGSACRGPLRPGPPDPGRPAPASGFPLL